MTSNRLYNYINLGRKLFIAKFNKHQLISVSYHITCLCNYKCKHCYAVLERHEKTDPTLEQILEVIDGLARRGTLSIRLLGGEPLLRKDLPQIIMRIKKNGMFCEIITNGSLVRRRLAEWPELRMADSFCISLDGDKELHESLRGEGTFDQTMDGLLALLEYNLPVRFHATMAKISYDLQEKPHQFLIELSKKYDIPFNIATYCPNPEKSQEHESENVQSFLFSRDIYRDLLEAKKNGVKVSTSTGILEKAVEWFDHTKRYLLLGKEKDLPKGYLKCHAGIRNCFIDADGGMYICVFHWGKGLNVYEDGLEKAYKYMVQYKINSRHLLCYNIGQWEYTRLFTFSDPMLLWSVMKNIFNLLKSNRNRKQGETKS